MLDKKEVEKRQKRDRENLYIEEEKKKLSKPIRILIAVFVLILIISLAGLFVYFFCDVRTVNISGNTILVEEEIKRGLIVDEYDKNCVLLILRNRFMPRRDIPFVESMEMSMSDLNTVNVKVKEKPITGYIKGKKKRERVYYNQEGTVMELSRVKVKGAILTVPGSEVGDAVVGEPLPIREKSRRELVALNRELSQNEIKIKKITLTDEGNFILNYKNITIKFGTASFMTEKVTRLKVILPKIKKKEGILHLEDWSEGTTDIVFEMLDKDAIDTAIKDETGASADKKKEASAAESAPASGEGTSTESTAGTAPETSTETAPEASSENSAGTSSESSTGASEGTAEGQAQETAEPSESTAPETTEESAASETTGESTAPETTEGSTAPEAAEETTASETTDTEN